MKFGSFTGVRQERRADGDRRSGEDRRRSDDATGDERRGSGERRQGDRRIMRCGVRFATTRSISVIEEFLEAECRGEWHIVLDDISPDLSRKQIRIMFELEEDKDRFLERFRR